MVTIFAVYNSSQRFVFTAPKLNFVCNKMLQRKPELTVTRCSVIAERSRCMVEDWNWETIFYGHYRSTFNHPDIIGLQSY